MLSQVSVVCRIRFNGFVRACSVFDESGSKGRFFLQIKEGLSRRVGAGALLANQNFSHIPSLLLSTICENDSKTSHFIRIQVNTVKPLIATTSIQ